MKKMFFFCCFIISVVLVGFCPCLAETRQNGFICVSSDGGRIASLRFDSSGKGNYGLDTVASEGSIRGCKNMAVSGNTLTLYPSEGAIIEWDIPLFRSGYYDPDLHFNYPHEKDINEATPLTLPFLCFVGGTGHTVRVEHFKRLPDGPYMHYLNLGNSGRLLMCSDSTQNWDLEVSWQGSNAVKYISANDKITLVPYASGEVRITVLPRGARETPGNSMLMPKAIFQPDPKITYAPTGKTVSGSGLLTDFMRMGTFWYPNNLVVSEWAVAADLHLNDDPRSWYLKQLRRDLLENLKWVGYDRFGHFGYAFAWSRYPDYGAGGLLNLPSNNAPYDMRMLQVNGIWLRAIARYVLATGDVSILQAKRTRAVSTNGDEPQPICGKGWDSQDYVLSAGDVRLDGKPASVHHTLGQEFTASAKFSEVSALLGNPSGAEPNHGKIALYDRYGGKLIAESAFSIAAGKASEYVKLSTPECRPGKYYLEVTDDDSGMRYFGPGVVWWTKTEDKYAGGDAYNGPFRGDVEACLNLLIDYMRKHMGAEKTNIAYYQNDPEYNTPVHRSGRNKVCTENSYWETAGGAYDSYVAIWYNEACSHMAKLYDLLGDKDKSASFARLKQLADKAYSDKFRHTVDENGVKFSRFFGCLDWDGVIHDYGFTHYNLETAAAGIAAPNQIRDILWWLDRGQYSPDGGKTWRDNLYSIWQAVPPFNTIETSSWVNVTGTLPWRQVLVNGGGRLDTAARDLYVRARHLSIDNMHERNERILERFANPDRLTGGRTFNDPGGRGRWHFLEPDSDLADFEGFREIFPQGGIVASYQPINYFGIEYTGAGLVLRPKVPSKFTSVEFGSFGYWGAAFYLRAKALRKDVLSVNGSSVCAVKPGNELGREFKPRAEFNKVGLRVSVSPFKAKHDNKLTITLYKSTGNKRVKVAENWYSHAENGQWVWVDAGKYLPADSSYYVSVSKTQPADGEIIGLYCAKTGNKPIIRVVDEKTELTIKTVYNPNNHKFTLAGAETGSAGMIIVLKPGEQAILKH